MYTVQPDRAGHYTLMGCCMEVLQTEPVLDIAHREQMTQAQGQELLVAGMQQVVQAMQWSPVQIFAPSGHRPVRTPYAACN